MNGGIWVHRFALFSELVFYEKIVQCIGGQTLSTGNYLISIRHNNPALISHFESFRSDWKSSLNLQSIFKKSMSDMDGFTLSQRNDATKFVKEKCLHFKMMDGVLFSQFMFADQQTVKSALDDLKKMLLSENRLLRKRSTQFILRFFPMMSLKIGDLWADVSKSSNDNVITLDLFNKLSPSILAEAYLWLSLSSLITIFSTR